MTESGKIKNAFQVRASEKVLQFTMTELTTVDGVDLSHRFGEFNEENMQKNLTNSGWDIVDGKPVYLSDSRIDCKCGITVTKILLEEISTILQEDLNILSVQKKIYNPNGIVNDINSLNVILPFWLYLKLQNKYSKVQKILASR